MGKRGSSKLIRENKTIDLYCKRCRKSLHVAYELTGDMESPVLPNITMKCTCCTRVMTFKNYKERQIVERMKNNKYYI